MQKIKICDRKKILKYITKKFISQQNNINLKNKEIGF